MAEYRRESVGAWREMASLMPGKSSPNRLIIGTTPDVETVMRRFDICVTKIESTTRPSVPSESEGGVPHSPLGP
jgi:hypothetical protein